MALLAKLPNEDSAFTNKTMRSCYVKKISYTGKKSFYDAITTSTPGLLLTQKPCQKSHL